MEKFDSFEFANLITNDLGYSKILHFDDSDTGLVRHLAAMEIALIYTGNERLKCRVRTYIDRTIDLVKYGSREKIHVLRDNRNKVYAVVEVKKDGTKKVLYQSSAA